MAFPKLSPDRHTHGIKKKKAHFLHIWPSKSCGVGPGEVCNKPQCGHLGILWACSPSRCIASMYCEKQFLSSSPELSVFTQE